MSTIALAVKYRPNKFDDVVEQGSVKTILSQQLESGEIRHAYLFCGGAGTGKTTTARIFANEINQGQGVPMEMDAASNNSVNDVRNIIQQSRMATLDGSKYRIFIVDECMTGDVEILTTQGFKRFDACDGTEQVAQYNDDGSITFVSPHEWVRMPYKGNLVKWSPRNWCSVRMTPHHVQPLYHHRSGTIREQYIQDTKFSQIASLIVAGCGKGSKTVLTPIDRLVIASQADGTIQRVSKKGGYVHWSIQLTKQRKVDRFINLCESGNIHYSEIKGRDGVHRFTYDLPISSSKMLSTHFRIDSFDYFTAREFIQEVVQWDGYVSDNYIQYISTCKENSDFVMAVATLGGYSARLRAQSDERKETYKTRYNVFLRDSRYSSCQAIQKTVETEYFDGTVYCVKVPSHKIVVRSEGFVFVTGNCHALSGSAWQAMLKLLEEPPETAIFIFCTTDPQKIPKTILSRVQRYDFQRISQDGIVNRLKYIVDQEWKENPDWDAECDTDALEYIAKLADGGMRDAITLLDKCLAYSKDLVLEDVVEAVGAVDFDEMLHLVDALVENVKESPSTVITVIEDLHRQGKDLKLFVRNFTNFVLDLCKFAVTDTLDFTQIPNYYKDALLVRMKQSLYYSECNELLRTLLKLNSEIKWDTYPKAMIEATLYSFCVGGMTNGKDILQT